MKTMRKRTINILSVVIIIILAFITIVPVIGFCTGVVVGVSSAETNSDKTLYPVDVRFMPDFDTYISPVDSVTTADGRVMPAIHQETLLMVDDKTYTAGYAWISGILTLASFVFFLLFAVTFTRFIININADRIFVEHNARLLRRMAIFLFAMAVAQVCGGLIHEFSGMLDSIAISGYTITMAWSVPWAVLLIGFMALIMSSVWQRGIRLKEEQDLTI